MCVKFQGLPNPHPFALLTADYMLFYAFFLCTYVYWEAYSQTTRFSVPANFWSANYLAKNFALFGIVPTGVCGRHIPFV